MIINDLFWNLKNIHKQPQDQKDRIRDLKRLDYQTKKTLGEIRQRYIDELRDIHKTDNVELDKIIQKQKELEKEINLVSKILIEHLQKARESFLGILQEEYDKIREKMIQKQSKEVEHYEMNGKNTEQLRKQNTDEILKEETHHNNDQLEIKNQYNACEQEIKKFTEILTRTFNESTSKLIRLDQKKQSENISITKARQKKSNPHVHKNKKIIYSLIISVIAVSVLFGYVNLEESHVDISEIKSSFVIQNLRGDTVDTWVAWQIAPDSILNVNLVNSPEFTPERLSIIRDTIMSQETLEIDDSLLHKGPEGQTSTYYVGWTGALQSIQTDTQLPIPADIRFDSADRETGDVVINLTNDANADGYTAYTTAIADESNHQMLKAKITVYDIDRLSDADLSTIVRHEMGHALGLAHSTAPEDLMHPVIATDYPYISECDIDAIVSLYDGSQNSQVICEK